MSGGVDSSLSAALLKEAGYEVTGVHMQLWREEGAGDPSLHPAGRSLRNASDADQVCRLLGIPFHVLNFETEFRNSVIDYFCREYAQGRTPNPCVTCNQQIKFNLLLSTVLAQGAEYLATGHYARIEGAENGYRLLRGTDSSNDQSYFLYTLGQRELRRLLFPLGNCRKTQVRRMAAERGLPVADKPKSQDLCFIPGGRYRDFLMSYLPPISGDIVDMEGNVLGKHRGIASYTVGQRTGLGLSSEKRLYVIAIDAATNSLVVGPEDKLFASRLLARGVRFVSEEPEFPAAIRAKIRYKSPEINATLRPCEKGVEVLFHKPQRAITPGQAVVFYDGERVLGGGIIEAS